jgi:hypothetical protein
MKTLPLFFSAIAALNAPLQAQMIQNLLPRVDNYAATYGSSDPTLKQIGESASANAQTSQAVFDSFIDRTIQYDQDRIEKARYPNGRTYTVQVDDGEGGTRSEVRNHSPDEEAGKREMQEQRHIESQRVTQDISSRRGAPLNSYEQKYGKDRNIANNPDQWDKMPETQAASQTQKTHNQILRNDYQVTTQVGDDLISIQQQPNTTSPAENRSYAQKLLAEIQTEGKTLSAKDKTPAQGTQNALKQTLLESALAGENSRGQNPTAAQVASAQTISAQTANQTMSQIKKQTGLAGKKPNLQAAKAALDGAQTQSLKTGTQQRTLTLLAKQAKDQIATTDTRLTQRLAFSGGEKNPNGWDTNADGNLDKGEAKNQRDQRVLRRSQNESNGWQGAAIGDDSQPLADHQDFNSQDTQNLTAAQKLSLATAFRNAKDQTPITSSHLQGRRFSRQTNQDNTPRTFNDDGVNKQLAERHARRSQTPERLLFKGTDNERVWERSGANAIHEINNEQTQEETISAARVDSLNTQNELAPAGLPLRP